MLRPAPGKGEAWLYRNVAPAMLHAIAMKHGTQRAVLEAAYQLPSCTLAIVTPMPATATPRLLTSDDLEAYIALRREMLLDSPWAYGSAPGEDSGSDPSVLAKRLTMAHNAILVIDNPASPGCLIAAAGVVRSHRVKTCHHATIWGVYVQPDHRGKGHGRAIVRAAMDIASEWPGVAVIDIAVSSNSPEALKLYESLGFERWGTEPDAVRVDSQSFDDVHMCLRLEPGATASDQRESAVRRSAAL